MEIYHCKTVEDTPHDAYILAENPRDASMLFSDEYGYSPDYLLRLTCGGSKLLMAREEEREA